MKNVLSKKIWEIKLEGGEFKLYDPEGREVPAASVTRFIGTKPGSPIRSKELARHAWANGANEVVSAYDGSKDPDNY